MTHTEMGLNLLQSLKMIAHVSERMLYERRRKFYKLPVVVHARCRCIMAVLMLSDRECCAAASQDSSNDGDQNPHVSSCIPAM